VPVVSQVQEATEAMVYVIQNSLGAVSQYGLADGSLKWEIDCATVTGDNNCALAAQAEFRCETHVPRWPTLNGQRGFIH
jgi:hypothetical protein